MWSRTNNTKGVLEYWDSRGNVLIIPSLQYSVAPLLLFRIVRQGLDDVGIPGAVEVQPFVLLNIAVFHVHPRRMYTQEHPRQISTPRPLPGLTRNHRSAARAAVHLRVRQEVALSLKAEAERRGGDRLPHHEQMVQCVVKPQREAHDEHSRSDFYFIQLFDQMIGCKGLNKKFLRQRRALELHGDDVDRAGRVDAFQPRRLVSLVEWDDEIGC